MQDYKNNSIVFKALCDENRLKILEMIKDGEICACKLLEDAAKKAVDRNYYRCAARVLYYYDHFFAAA